MKAGRLIVAGCLLLALGAAGAWLWTPDKPRRWLEDRYLRSPHDMIALMGMRLHVRDDGPRDAPALVMIHGFGSSLQTWDAWSEALHPDYRVIRLDLPGSGLSAPDPRHDYTDARTIQLLVALMDRLGVRRATLIGNSIGGRIAWSFAAEHPERTCALVLISPDGFASPGFAYGVRPKVPAVMAVMRYILPRALLRMNLAPAYADPTRLSARTVSRYYDLMRAPGVRDALLDRMKQTVLVDPRPLLRRISAPMLLMWGERDGMIPVSNAKDFLRELHHAAFVAFPDLGHAPQEEGPAESLVPLRAFLAKAASPGRRRSAAPDQRPAGADAPCFGPPSASY